VIRRLGNLGYTKVETLGDVYEKVTFPLPPEVRA